jgi:cytochrome c oxidase subunit III
MSALGEPTVGREELALALNDRRAPVFWGMVFLIIIEITVFSAFITSYFYLRHFQEVWPLDGIKEPDLLMPTIGTGIILLSSLPVAWGDRSMRSGNRRRMMIGLGLGAVLALAFLVLKVIEYSGAEYRWHTNAYGSIVWTIIGFHSAHVLSLLAKTLVVVFAGSRGYFSGDRNMGVQVNGLYWHFVVLIWLPLYFTIYLSHHVL